MMNQDKTIGVLLPVYKADNPQYIKQSVNSLLQQTYKKIKIYIGVDRPVYDEVDRTLKDISDGRVSIIRFEQNRGLAKVLNDLISHARLDECEYYARMDADDISLPDRFAKQVLFLEQNPEVDVVGGAIEEIDEESKDTGKKVSYPMTNMECRKFFRYRDPLAHPAVMFKNRFFDKVEGYRPEYRKNQDTMLWYDGFLNGCVFSNLNSVVLKFRVTSDFYNRRNGWKRAKQMLRDRLRINRDLKYDVTANLFAFAMFLMTISPNIVKKILYKIR